MSTTPARSQGPRPQVRPPSAGGRGRRAGTIALGCAAAVLLALGLAVWILPGMLDWNRYRGSVAGLVSAALGRPVEIDGNITLHLLPQPILTAASLHVNDAGDGVAMTVREVRLRVALGPLLAGRVDARELELRGADLHLPWPPPAGALSRRPPAWLTSLQARVEESRLVVGSLALDEIGATLAVDPETGLLSVAGAAKLFGLAWRMTARLGTPGRDGAAPLDFSLDGQGKLRDSGGSFSGVLAADGALAGRVAARGPDLSQAMPAPALPWRADGRLSAADGLAVADELALEIGGSPARGAVALRVQPEPRLDLAITAGRLDLDAWAPVLLHAAQLGRDSGVIPTGIDLSAEAATLAGGTVRHMRAAFDADRDGITVREAAALLPGEAALSLRGQFPSRGKPLGFEGSVGLAAPDLRATLRWLEPFAPALLQGLPARALRSGALTATVAADPAQISLTDLKGTLDGAAAQGGLALRLGPRPGVSAGLTFDRLLLDPFVPEADVLAQPADTYLRIGRALAGAPLDADLKLQVRQASLGGTAFGPLSLDAQEEGGRLTVRRFEATALGIHATASGTLGGAGDGIRLSEGRVELTTQDVSPVRGLLPPELLATPALLRGPASLLVQLAGPADALAVRLTLDVNDLRAEAQPTLNLPARRIAGALTLHHPGAPRLLEQLGMPGTASWLGDGSFSLVAQLAAAPGRIEVGNAEVVAGSLRLQAQAALAGQVVSGRVRAETLTLPAIYPRSSDPLPLELVRRVSGALHVEAGEVLAGLAPVVQGLTGELEADGGRVTLRDASARLSGGTVGGSIVIDGGEKPGVRLHGEVRDVVLGGVAAGGVAAGGVAAGGVATGGAAADGTLDLPSGVLGLTMDLSGEGSSPAALTATLAGSGSGSVRDAVVSGVDLLSTRSALLRDTEAVRLDAALRDALQSGRTRLPRLDVRFEARGGVATVAAAGAGEPGGVSLQGTIDVFGRAFDGVLTVQPGDALPDVPVRLGGAIGAPTRTPELAGVLRWLAERP